MANWRALLARVRDWLKPDGRLFIHVFTHRTTPYRFDVATATDWIAQHFFTGGVMPSHGLIRQFDDLFERRGRLALERAALPEDGARLAGQLRRATSTPSRPVLREVYGEQAWLWRQRWRLFFLATAGLFGDSGGEEWGVSHYRLRPRVRLRRAHAEDPHRLRRRRASSSWRWTAPGSRWSRPSSTARSSAS